MRRVRGKEGGREGGKLDCRKVLESVINLQLEKSLERKKEDEREYCKILGGMKEEGSWKLTVESALALGHGNVREILGLQKIRK